MSDIKVNCPHCKQPLEVPEEMFGTIAECPSCNEQIQLPPRQAETRTSTLMQQTKAPQPKQRVVVQPPLQRTPMQPLQQQNSQPQKSSKTLFIVVSALVIVVLCLVAAVVVLLNRQVPVQNEGAVKTGSLQASSESSSVGQANKSEQASLPASAPKVEKNGKVADDDNQLIVKSFEKFIDSHLNSYRTNKRDIVAKCDNGWSKDSFEAVAEHSIDIQRTTSLVSPYSGVCEFSLLKKGTAYHSTRAEAVADQVFVGPGKIIKHRHSYAFQGGTWVVKSRQHYFESVGEWMDCNDLQTEGVNKGLSNFEGCHED